MVPKTEKVTGGIFEEAQEQSLNEGKKKGKDYEAAIFSELLASPA